MFGTEQQRELQAKLRFAPQIQLVDDKAERQWRMLYLFRLLSFKAAKVIDFADAWARLMQLKKETGKTIADVAKATREEAGYDQLSPDMYVEALRLLSALWVHGTELRQWHNARYLNVFEFTQAEANGIVANPQWFLTDVEP